MFHRRASRVFVASLLRRPLPTRVIQNDPITIRVARHTSPPIIYLYTRLRQSADLPAPADLALMASKRISRSSRVMTYRRISYHGHLDPTWPHGRVATRASARRRQWVATRRPPLKPSRLQGDGASARSRHLRFIHSYSFRRPRPPMISWKDGRSDRGDAGVCRRCVFHCTTAGREAQTRQEKKTQLDSQGAGAGRPVQPVEIVHIDTQSTRERGSCLDGRVERRPMPA